MTRMLIGTAAACLAVTALAGCSSSSSGDAATTAEATASLVGGMAVCDEASLRGPLEEAMKAEGSDMTILSIDSFECSDGWAVVFPEVGTNEEDAVTITSVLEAEGQFWIPKDRDAVCGTAPEDGSGTRPDDAQVPADLYQAACNTN